MEQEDRYLNELRRVKAYTLSGNRLEMSDEHGAVILTFQMSFPDGIPLNNFCTTKE